MNELWRCCPYLRKKKYKMNKSGVGHMNSVWHSLIKKCHWWCYKSIHNGVNDSPPDASSAPSSATVALRMWYARILHCFKAIIWSVFNVKVTLHVLGREVLPGNRRKTCGRPSPRKQTLWTPTRWPPAKVRRSAGERRRIREALDLRPDLPYFGDIFLLHQGMTFTYK